MKAKIEANCYVQRYEYLLLALLLIVALAIHLHSTWGGLLWSSDSFHYWSASRSFTLEGSLKAADGGSMTFWPPLFPILLSFFSESSYYVFHAFCFIGSFIFIYLQLKCIANIKMSLLVLTIVIISVYPYLLSSFLWTETLFVLFLYSGLYFYERWYQNKHKIDLLILSILCLTLMCIQRNAGVFIMVGLSMFVLHTSIKEKNWLFLLKIAFIHLIIVAPNIIWNLYQKITQAEEYNAYTHLLPMDFIDNFEAISAELIRFFIPYNIHSYPSISLLLLGGVILISTSFGNKKLIHQYVIAFYLLLFLCLPKLESSEVARFLAPIYPLMAFQLVSSSKASLFRIPRGKTRLFVYAIASFIILYNIARTVKNSKQWHHRSIHYPKANKIYF